MENHLYTDRPSDNVDIQNTAGVVVNIKDPLAFSCKC